MSPSRCLLYARIPILGNDWKTEPVEFEKPLRYNDWEWSKATRLANEATDAEKQICEWICRKLSDGRDKKKTKETVDAKKEQLKKRLRELDIQSAAMKNVFYDVKQEIDSLKLYHKRIENCVQSLCQSRSEINIKSLQIIKSYNFTGDMDSKDVEKRISEENTEISSIRKRLEKHRKSSLRIDNTLRRCYYNLGKELQNLSVVRALMIIEHSNSVDIPSKIGSETKFQLSDVAERKKLVAKKTVTSTVELRVEIDEYLCKTGKKMKKWTKETDDLCLEHYKKFEKLCSEWSQRRESLEDGVRQLETKICDLDKALRKKNSAVQNAKKNRPPLAENTDSCFIKEEKIWDNIYTLEETISKAECILRKLLRDLFEVQEKCKLTCDCNSKGGYSDVPFKLRNSVKIEDEY